MRLREFVLMIVSVVKRLVLHRDERHRRMFIDLSAILIARQDRKPLPIGWEVILTPYRDMIARYARSLARGLETGPDSVGRLLWLPLGCRFGKLQFSPILQLAKLLGNPDVGRLMFGELPRTKRQLFCHFQAILGREGYNDGHIAGFKPVLGFTLTSYVDRLVMLRGEDPVTFVMLLAHEFKFALERADPNSELELLVKRGAALAELGRLVEIVSYLKGHRVTLGDLRFALQKLRGRLTDREPKDPRVKLARPLIDQFAYGVEAIRALFLGDRAGRPLAAAPSWMAVTPAMRIAAVARCAWFANNRPVARPGFRTMAKRFIRGRRGSAYTYFGIPLDMLLVVGLKDLANSLEQTGGIHSICALAEEIHRGLFQNDDYGHGRMPEQSCVYAEVYLREAARFEAGKLREPGHGGSGNRFDPRHWFATQPDDALYARLWQLFVRGANVGSDRSARYQIRRAIGVLKQLIQPHWTTLMPVDPTLASSALSHLACGLTPVSMDPIFAALVERSLIERGVSSNFLKDPAKELAQQALQKRLFERLVIRPAYARFEGVDGRLNHDPYEKPAQPLCRRRTLPKPLRRGAN